MPDYPPPRILITAPYSKTTGPQITSAAALAGIELDGAQQLCAEVIGARGPAGWAHFETVLFQPRQNGKSEILLATILFCLFVERVESVVFSSHAGRTSSQIFRRVRHAVERTPEFGGRVKRVLNRLGAETLELESGQRLECVARSSGSGRGFTADVIILDEAHDLGEDEMAAVLPAISTRPGARLIYALSFADQQSTHLGRLRQRALTREDPHLAWCEWSMSEQDTAGDRAVWLATNPAAAAGRISASYLEKEYRALGAAAFAQERLGRAAWPQDESSRFAVISRADWDGCLDMSLPPVEMLYPVSFGIAVSRDSRDAAIAVCGSSDGIPVLEVADWRTGHGPGWVPRRLRKLTQQHQPAAAAWDDDGSAGPLGIRHIIGDAQAINLKPADYAQACGTMALAFTERTVRHRGDDRLTAAAGAARAKILGRAWIWHPDTPGAVLLEAACYALHAAQTEESEPGAWMISIGGPPSLTPGQMAAWQPSGGIWPPQF
jgi:hypothetical protein